MNEHTEGPWDYACVGDGYFVRQVYSPREVIAIAPPVENIFGAGNNARLIAAAPELLAVLVRHAELDIDMHATEVEWSQWRRDQAAAIHKATGKEV